MTPVVEAARPRRTRPVTWDAGPSLLLNGRFLSRHATGVDRVATELARALLRQTERATDRPFRLAHPPAPVVDRASRPRELLQLETVPTPGLKGHAWEQSALARVRPDDWLLSLCNLGPVLRRNQVVMIHDAQVFTQPATYSRTFRTVYQAMLPRLARRARIVLTVSDYSRCELEACGVLPPGKAVVVHNGVDHLNALQADTNILARQGLRSGRYLLAIGSQARHKNLSMLVSAAEARTNRAVPLVVAGGMDSRVYKGDGVRESDGVRLLSRVTDTELKALYTHAMALVFPSLTEGFGLPPLEAMTCGCPVVASTGGAVPEVCGDATLYCDPMVPAAWTRAMERVAEDANLRAHLRKSGAARAAEFTWERAAKQVLQAIAAEEEAPNP